MPQPVSSVMKASVGTRPRTTLSSKEDKYMYIQKNELIRRLVSLTGKDRIEFINHSVEALSNLYEQYHVKEKVYIDVPYRDKNIVKLLGAEYDAEDKKWFIPAGVDTKLFDRWMK